MKTKHSCSQDRSHLLSRYYSDFWSYICLYVVTISFLSILLSIFDLKSNKKPKKYVILIVNLVCLQVQPQSVSCPHCPKKCKSKSGLKRHITVKHKDKIEETEKDKPENPSLTVETYASIVGKAKVKIRDSKICPAANRDEI